MTVLIEQLEGGAYLLTVPAQCRACGKNFISFSSLKPHCSLKCALADLKAKEAAEKADRRATKARLAELDPRRYPKAKAAAQDAFNLFVRLRDAHQPCICCGRTESPQWDAGHYLSRGARPELSFDEDNCHKQAGRCNTYKAGNATAYRVGLVARIGEARVQRLEGPHPTAKWTVDDLKAIQRTYAAKARELKEQLEGATP